MRLLWDWKDEKENLSIHFKEGAEVKKGDLLFVIDPRPYQAEVDRAEAELKRAEVTYEELARRLHDMGIEETKGSVTVKVNRGAFPAWFFFAAMRAIGRETVNLGDL